MDQSAIVSYRNDSLYINHNSFRSVLFSLPAIILRGYLEWYRWRFLG